MNKLHFNDAKELVDFTIKIAQCAPIITINCLTFKTACCELISDDIEFIEIFDKNHNLICSMRTGEIKKINEYTIIKEWRK